MPTFPLFVDLKKRKCVVVGGGRIATRKIAALLEFGAEIVVVSPEVSEQIAEFESKGRITVMKRQYCISFPGKA